MCHKRYVAEIAFCIPHTDNNVIYHRAVHTKTAEADAEVNLPQPQLHHEASLAAVAITCGIQSHSGQTKRNGKQTRSLAVMS